MQHKIWILNEKHQRFLTDSIQSQINENNLRETIVEFFSNVLHVCEGKLATFI